jgi:hypothetical protein
LFCDGEVHIDNFKPPSPKGGQGKCIRVVGVCVFASIIFLLETLNNSPPEIIGIYNLGDEG